MVALVAGRLRAGLVVRGRHAELELDPAHALERALEHDPLAGEQVADDAERGQQHRGVEQHGAEDQRLDVAGALALEDVEVEEAAPDDERDEPDQRSRRVMNTRSGSYIE